MNESTKTGIFWGIAAVMLVIAVFVSWPTPNRGGDKPIAGQPLFKEFEDPLTAANLRVVTFDETLGQLETFEVRKDAETGRWTIPSRQGYPADATEQMADAANSLIGLKILDVQTANPEDHDDLGVVEPKLEDLQVGAEGVGRLVTFKDETQDTIASLIVGNEVEGEEGKVYVRKPGQDPVYVVNLDDKPITTRFEDWIEEDLLQLSSIDVRELEIKEYNASLGLNGVALNRNYTASVSTDGTDWNVDELSLYDPDNPLADPNPADRDPNEVPNEGKFDEIKNALDDLEIVDVVRKPEGMSANLRAEEELVSDNEAVTSLAERGFYPLQLGPDSATEIISANGELSATLENGVQYVLRFGNVAGLSEDEVADGAAGDEGGKEEEEEVTGGVNRYLLVTTRVDESYFPVPDLEPIPQNLQDLEAMLVEEPAEPAAGDDAEAKPQDDSEQPAAADESEDGETSEDAEQQDDAQPSETADQTEADQAEMEKSPEGDSQNGAEAADESDDGEPDDQASDAAEGGEAPTEEDAGEAESAGNESTDEDAGDNGDQPAAAKEGGIESNGSGEASGTGQGHVPEPQDPADQLSERNSGSDEAPSDETPATDQTPADDTTESSSEPDADSPPSTPATGDAPANGDAAKSGDDDSAGEDDSPAEADPAEPTSDDDEPSFDELTEAEKLERLEAEQEKITQRNQRKLDERKDKIEEARKRVRELNARFADWYYVIPEGTYQKLRVRRGDIFISEEEAEAEDDPATTGTGQSFQPPNINLPGGSLPGAGN